MTVYQFVIDDCEVCHLAACDAAMHPTVPYYPPKNVQTKAEMVEHLARPDVKDRRFATGPLVPCDDCLLGLPAS